MLNSEIKNAENLIKARRLIIRGIAEKDDYLKQAGACLIEGIKFRKSVEDVDCNGGY